ncbi:MAG: glycosyltransferase family 9 protein [Planctomycetota bacterium]|nr:glycosyltransferase family 9 protein [Planctomycetota bacterium]
MNAPQRILIIRPSALGDVCRSVPVLASLRAAFPDARIDWLVQDTFADAIVAHPALTNAIPFARREISDQIKSGKGTALRALLARLKEPEYTLVLDCQGLARSGFFAWATRAPRRVGLADARELGWLGLTERVRVEAGRHAVDRMLDLVRAAGVTPLADMRLYPPRDALLRVLADPDIPRNGYVLIAPTSRWPGKQWPDDRFVQIARRCLDQGYRVVIVGSRAERSQIPRLLDLPLHERRVIDRVGATTIGDLMGLVAGAKVVIGNDSAAIHMAVGFAKPLIALFGPTDVSLVGPYKREGDVLQHVQPGERLDHKLPETGRRIMERISVDEVKLRLDAALLEA